LRSLLLLLLLLLLLSLSLSLLSIFVVIKKFRHCSYESEDLHARAWAQAAALTSFVKWPISPHLRQAPLETRVRS
jgi:hypothetical protein